MTLVPSPVCVRRVAILGAGVMGAQIAAHLANADVSVMLFDLAAKEGDPSGDVGKAIERLQKMDPAPLASRERRQLIVAANYDEHLEELRSCDLVIEAIGERLDWKSGLYARIAPYIHERAVLATNTSGLSINVLAKSLPEGLRARFCGMHFFNPPRYMPLVELIPGQNTDPRVLDRLETFLVTTLGKGVIRAKDTPNFVANRVGVFSILTVFHHGAQFGLPLDLIDALTGPAIGRAKSATYRTADIVGLDTLAHVVDGSRELLSDDPWCDYFTLPAWMRSLIDGGALGQKTGAGVYRKQGKEILVLDPASGEYKPADARPDKEVQAMLNIPDGGERFAALRASAHPEAQFVWAIMRDVFRYSAFILEHVADTARDVDLAMRWGFGWSRGPFETWQAAGWNKVAHWLREDRAAAKGMSPLAPLPDWVSAVDRVHSPKGSYSAVERKYKPRSQLAVYRRQLFPQTVIGEANLAYGEAVLETDAVRLWHTGDDVAVLSFKSKMHTIGEDVLDGVLESLRIAEQRFAALVLWQPEAPFSVGANLAQVVPMLQSGHVATVEQLLGKFQQTTCSLRNAPVPVVAAVEGLALGGGCEFLMHCDRVVAALESYIGLVEVGVGLLPAGGGCKELARRAVLEAKGNGVFPFIRQYFETVAKGRVAKSAEEARQIGFLGSADCVVFNPWELLFVAKSEAKALAEAAYRSPLPKCFPVVGRTGIANLKLLLVNMAEGGFISSHDYEVGCKVAEVICGGDVDPGTLVSEEWMLGLERAAFMELIQTPKTQARIEHTLKTGKPLRN